MRIVLIGWVVVSGVCLAACDSPLLRSGPEDEVLARVYDQTLYASALEGMFPPGATAEDSANIVRAYASRWVREALILHQAEKNIPADLDLDRLVADYRASLLRHNYEEQLVAQQMDSTVTEAELVEFYEQNKEQYQLETPIIRCHFIKVPQPVPNSSELRRLWNSEDPDDFDALVTYCTQYAEAHALKDSVWHKLDDIAIQLPKGTLTPANVNNRRNQSVTNVDYQYYLRILEVKKRREISPLSYIRDQAERAILHARRVEFLEREKQELFEREMRTGRIRTYFQ